MAMVTLGTVVIGRNEGDRLQRCLASLSRAGAPMVYVDSGSSDDSVQAATALGAEVVKLDSSVPFSASRARNAGFERLLQIAPEIRYVQFIDGDCEVVPGWLTRATQTLDEHPEVAVVCGRRRERNPEASIYNRLADLEWDRPAGEVQSCGGDAMMRADAFRTVEGFEPSIVAGEEPELCQRLRGQGWQILRINADMTLHDAAMLQFCQWWRRQVRSGYGALDVSLRFGRGRKGLFSEQVRSARIWTIGWGVAVLFVATGLGLVLGPAAAAIGGLIIAAAVPLQVVRLAIESHPRTRNWRTAVAYGLLTIISKWANLVGQAQYLRDVVSGRSARLIEYKERPAASASPSAGSSAI